MIKNGHIDTLKNMKNVILRMRDNLIIVLDYLDYMRLVVCYKKLTIMKFIINITKDENI